MPRAYMVYECEDGETFRNVEAAEAWERRILECEKATRLFREGGLSLMAALTIAETGMRDEDRAELSRVFAATGLRIEHWQCRTEAGYHVHKILPSGKLVVGGDAGSWSGHYWGESTPAEVAYYFRQTPAEKPTKDTP